MRISERFITSPTAMVLLMALSAAVAAWLVYWLVAQLHLVAIIWPGFADACSSCVDPSNGMPTVAAAGGIGTSIASGVYSGAQYGDPTDPRNPYRDSRDVARLARDTRGVSDPRNSPGAQEARQTGGGYQTTAPTRSVNQGYNPAPAPTSPPKTFKETLDSDRGWTRYGPRWPTPTPTPSPGH